MNFLKPFLRVSDSKTLFQNRGFYSPDTSTVAHLEKIGRKFLKGYHTSLSSRSTEELCTTLDTDDKDYRGFIYEGAAMANTILDETSLFSKKRLRSLMDHPAGCKHIYMLHVGAGWAFARLPVSIEKKIQKFDPVLRWLIIDGYGFHQAYFKTGRYVERMEVPRQLKSSYAIKSFYQGVGRCLWFIDCATPDRIAVRIAGFPPEYQADLWSGVGLASAYAGGANEEKLVALKSLAGKFFQHLAQGVVFAAKAREKANLVIPHNQIACKIICGLTVNEAASLADVTYSQIPDNLSSSRKYEWWRQTIRSAFVKWESYDPVVEKMN